MAVWDIVSLRDVSKFVRIPQSDIEEIWYEIAQGFIEEHTGWSLNENLAVTEKIDGTGAIHVEPSYVPLSSVTELKLQGSVVPSTHYQVNWDSIRLLSYRGDDITIYDNIYSIAEFTFGVGNVEVTYNCGGYDSLPSKYQYAVRACFLYIIKELSVFYRGEGSDQMLRTYRPDRTQNPEEVLINYGSHGKIYGILSKFLPEKKLYA